MKYFRSSCNGAIICMALICLCSLAPAAENDLKVRVEVFPNQLQGQVSPYIFGAGIDAKTNPLRAPKDPEKVFQDIADSGLRIARFPGGFVFDRNQPRWSWSNFYWQDHIGQNPDKLPWEVYDLDTFVQLCERFNIEPLMQINFVGEPQESVQGYIEYLVGEGDTDGDGVDWAARRKANGRVEPYKITYWELGNEVHSYPQGFQENAAGAKEYAEALERLVPVIRRMAPGAKIVVPFINTERPISGMKLSADDANINFSTSSEFALAFLRNLKVEVDYFDWHFYSANGWGGNWPYLGTDDEWKHYYCWGTKFRQCHEAILKLMRDECQQTPLPRIIVGEWSGDWTAAIFGQYENSIRGSLMRTMCTGVYMADILMYMMGQSTSSGQLEGAFWHTFCNDAQALFSIQTTRAQGIDYEGKSTDEGYGFRMPIYWVFKLLSEHHGEDLVHSQLEGENLIAAPSDGLYTDPPYEFERVSHCATRTGDRLYLALLNKDAHQPVEVDIRINGWQPVDVVEVYEVGDDDYLARNTIEKPNQITLQGPKTRQPRDAAAMGIILRPNRLTVLEYQADRF